MTRVCVYGLWHLGCVTAACLADATFDIVGLDPDHQRVAELQASKPPIFIELLNSWGGVSVAYRRRLFDGPRFTLYHEDLA